MNFTTQEIQSIGELRNADGSRRLTPVFKDSCRPVFVTISNSDFLRVKGNIEKMKLLAIESINNANCPAFIHSSEKNAIYQVCSAESDSSGKYYTTTQGLNICASDAIHIHTLEEVERAAHQLEAKKCF